MSNRPDWPDYFLGIACAVSFRATCPRRSVGVVIVDAHRRIVSTGYNGAPSGVPQCDEVGCLLVDGHCRRAIHADANAIYHGADRELVGCTMYIWGGTPCRACAEIIHAAGIVEVVCHGTYHTLEPVEWLRERGVAVRVVEGE